MSLYDVGKVTIIMPTFNCGKYIGDAVTSVLEQTYKNWELIIVDDGSEDNTAAVVSPYLADKRINYIKLFNNQGIANARNIALANASGDYVAFLDSDDVWMKDKLERQLSFMIDAGENCHFSCTSYSQVDEAGEDMHITIKPLKKVGYWGAIFLSDPIGNSTVIYDRNYFGNLTVPIIKKRNDFALWLKMMKGGDCCFGYDAPLAEYRVRKGSMTAKKMFLVKYHWKLYKDIEHLPIPLAMLAVLCWGGVKSVCYILRRCKRYLYIVKSYRKNRREETYAEIT